MNGNFNQVDSMDYSKIMSQKYRGINVWFGPSTDNDVMIFVTDALRLFPNKRISDFLNSKQTQELIEQISSETGISASQICYSTKGKYSDGRPQGTWMRRELALAFAMWLSSEFYLWCLNRLLELFSNGYVVLNQRNLDQIINDNPELQNIINQLQNENQRLKQDNYNLQNQMNNWGPKASYYDQVLQNSEYQYTLRDIQQSLGLKVSYKKLAKMLINDNYAYRNSDGRLYLRSPYSGEGYYGSTTELCKDGTYRTVMKWSEGGRRWIHSLAHKWGVD